jgi:hypothetical protein
MLTVRLWVCLLFDLLVIRCELFTSITHLAQLLNTQIALARHLEIYLTSEHEHVHPIEK